MIRKAKQEDIGIVSDIYEQLFKYQENNVNYSGWKRGCYPTKEIAENALVKSELYVYERDGKVIASSIINSKQDDDYALIDWSDNNTLPENVLVMHTLVISPNEWGKGIAKEFFLFYETLAKERSISTLRFDTNKSNKPAQVLYEKLGYAVKGIIESNFLKQGIISLVCYEKIIRN